MLAHPGVVLVQPFDQVGLQMIELIPVPGIAMHLPRHRLLEEIVPRQIAERFRCGGCQD
jgi:hypothetical protein